MFTNESLQRLREKVDLVEVLTGYIELKRAGASYKAICPFHQEKSPSFHMKQGDTHYHCFGCGAHGDAIQFLMNYLHVSFREAVETLAERFHVILEEVEKEEEKGVSREKLKEALELSSEFYNFFLLHAEEAREPLNYLFKRGLSLDFIRRFQLGYAPAGGDFFHKRMKDKKIDREVLTEAGLLNASGREFFKERITFPIFNARGTIVGFSARKTREEVFGGKYINTPETKLFKKSKLLYGLNYCRRRIAKERRAIIVEGQIDCLRLIDVGLDYAVAALGTAFGKGHVQELKQLGVLEVKLLFDGDNAGQAALSKVGDLFQKAGIGVYVIRMPDGYDPDSFLREHGKEALEILLGKGEEYLAFQVRHLSSKLPQTAAGKTALIGELSKQIKGWDEPVMIHESLRKLAQLTNVPEHMVGQVNPPRSQKVESFQINPNRILELDLLRWLVLLQREDFLETARHYLDLSYFFVPSCQKIYKALLEGANDLLALAPEIEDESLIEEIMDKKINRERAEQQFVETVQKLSDRYWLKKREAIQQKIHSGKESEEKVLELVREFDLLGKNRTEVKLQSV
ncbi:MAG: DNA primase [Chlamydiales bacterium]|nr:DNA primase [Chlamydiales bacterium]MCH9619909.1 DNA primase [Chlamydiales bacterium]MCH9622664.1 DNA primase [Chlamydiales bacterium]